jgi:PAS domain S-box-containing protein
MDDLAPPGTSIQTVMLDAVCDALTAAIIVYDRNDLIIFASRRLLTYFPLSETIIQPGTRLRDFLGALYDCRDKGASNAIASTRNASKHEWIAERLASHWKERSERTERLGSDRWLRYSKKRLPSGLGINVISDISEQKKREDQWRADLERVQTTEEILDSMPFPITVKDGNLAYVAVNREICTLLNTTPDGLLGRTLYDLHPRELAARIDADDRQVLDSGKPMTIPERLIRPDGEEALIMTRKQRIGKPGRYFLITIMEDVTALAVSGENGRPVLPGMEHLAFVHSSYLQSRAGFQQSALEDLSGHSILLVSANPAVIDTAGKTLKDAGVDFAGVVSLDEQRAFIDLASSSGVVIDLVIVETQMTLESLDLARSHGLSVLALDAAQLQHGLLKHLTGNFTERQDGPVLDDDWEISTSTAAPSRASDMADVLVVEDNDINQIVFSQILEGLGCSYVIAASGAEALRLFEAHAPQIVLMDVTLPDMDGFEVTRSIRDSGMPGGQHVPIIGVIAQAFEGDRETCAAAGMNDMLLKPISPDMIEAVFQQFFNAALQQAQR